MPLLRRWMRRIAEMSQQFSPQDNTVLPTPFSESHPLAPPEEILQDLTSHITKDDDSPFAAGAFGAVWKCTYKTDRGPIKVAVKSLHMTEQDNTIKKNSQRIQRELRICATLHHENILLCHGYAHGFSPLEAIVSAWAENGTLSTYLKHTHDILTIDMRFRLLRDIAAGLQYAHTNNVIHGDLTSLNVLVRGDGTACLADFGLSLMYSEVVSISKAAWTSSFHGNRPWLAPELLEDTEDGLPVRPSKTSDIYAFGGIMLQVLTNKTPYYYLSEPVIILSICTGVKPSRSRYPTFSDKYWHFIEQCWSTATQDRPSTESIVEMIRDELESIVLPHQAMPDSSTATISSHYSQPHSPALLGTLRDLTSYITKIKNHPVARGRFTEIWKCTYQMGRQQVKVAVKSFLVYAFDQPDELAEKYECELKVLARLKHVNILPVYGYTCGFGPLRAVVSPWAEGGNLTTFLEHEDMALTVVRRFEILRDITAGLQYLHTNDVIHGDLTGSNILIHDNGTACLADFGLSLMYSGVTSVSETTHTSCRNYAWSAPELLQGGKENELPVQPGKHSDIYSFGGIMLQVITSKIPYYYLSAAAIVYCIGAARIKPLLLYYPGVSEKYWRFIETCWLDATQARPLIEEVVKMVREELQLLYFIQTLSDHFPSIPSEELPQDLTGHITKTGNYPNARGGFGEIWKCIYNTDCGPIMVAVKSVLMYPSDTDDTMKKKQSERMMRELKTCVNLKHRNILTVYGYTFGFGPLPAIVSPWAENGNLMVYLHVRDTLTLVRRFQIFRDIAAGLQYLHANNVIHGDLTSPNVLIYGDGTACLADFGLSLMYSEAVGISQASWTSSFHGSVRWMAPERLADSEAGMPIRPSKPGDIYSFGHIILHALTSKIPYYYHRGDAALMQCIITGVKPLRSRYPAFSDKYWHFIEQCWSIAPQDRPSAERVVEVIRDELDLLSNSGDHD